MSLLEGVLAEILLHVRSTMNVARSINQFPNNILCLIFQYALDPLYDEDSPWPNRRSPLPSRKMLRNITHVCHRWREVAVSTSSLWTILCTRDYVPYDTVLQRSKDSLLKVHVHEGDAEMLKIFASDAATARIEELRLNYVSMDLSEPHPTSYVQFSAPNLRVAWLDDVEMTADGEGVVGPLLFQGNTPCLTSLTLDGVEFLPSNQFENLTHLSIVGLLSSSRATLSDVTAFLSGCSRLEELVVELLDVYVPPDSTNLHAPSLQNLRRMAIGSAETAGTLLASWLIAHANRSEGVTARIFDQDTFPLRSEFSSIYGPSFDGLHTLDVRALHKPECEPTLVVIACNALSVLRVECSKSNHSWLETDDQGSLLWCNWPLMLVRELHIRESEVVREHAGLGSLLSRLVSLTSLVVRVGYASKAEKSNVLRMLAGSQLLCADLTTLRVISEDVSVVDDIIALATIRAECKHPLRAVVLESTQQAVDEHALANLEALDACVDSLQVVPPSVGPDVEEKWPALCTGGAEIFWPALY
ncbi:hypothetical protein SCP_0116200 [Sparassis crispa]|uniref:F-box domain-containing protein n=1 Tax=Sparassis crispa TaxID=139825 RepID=A0A401G9A2_9APHY|nr:hypothetical protein SCP_0116200 [Sparassis crispa]GBE78729.1 hypothetical protein SCP_0116200 [Sparassis crispa]